MLFVCLNVIFLRWSYCAGYGKHTNAGGRGYDAGCAVLRVRRGRNGHGAGYSRKYTRSVRVGVACAFGKLHAVKGNGYVGKHGVKNVADYNVIGGNDWGVAEILHDYGVGYLSVIRNDGSSVFSPETILHMDWLCDNVDGTIPAYDELAPRGQSIVRLQGIYRDRIPPQKEGVIL